MSLSTVHTALAALVQTTLQAHDASFRVVTEIDGRLFDTPSRPNRVAVMGATARYAEVLFKRPSYDNQSTAFSQFKSKNKLFTFEVNVFWQVESGSAALFGAALDALLDALDQTAYLVSQDSPRLRVTLGSPQVGQDVSEPWLDTNTDERAHFLTFRIDAKQQS